jgi:deoxyinosine 3'endonuclease (endonuclease V)
MSSKRDSLTYNTSYSRSKSATIEEWIALQEAWKEQLMLEPEALCSAVDLESLLETFPLLGGVDITPDREHENVAYVGIAVLSSRTLELKYCQTYRANLEVPYIPGFLGFREAPALINAVECLKKEKPQYFPHVLFVDGNGILHPRGFGSACQVGLFLDLPTIGVAKSFLNVDGLNSLQVKDQLYQQENRWLPLFGSSHRLLGAALLSNGSVRRPIFVSVGYRIKLLEAVNLVFHACRYRVPEPIRIADHISREAARQALC